MPVPHNIARLRELHTRNVDKGANLPTPEEIRAACERIQSRWSKTERRNRAGAYAEQPMQGLVPINILKGE